jgi:hypothetical protein
MLSTRRDLLDLLARAAALPTGAEFLSAWLHAQESHQHSDAPPESSLLANYKPQFFASDDFAALQSFCEILIPTDDTPGAREARCAHFIDFLLHSAGEVPDMQRQWRTAMSALKEAGFHGADAAGRAAMIEAASRPERERATTHPLYSAYRLIKQQNTFAFYTSRAGLINALDYRGNSYNLAFPACTHPEHHRI